MSQLTPLRRIALAMWLTALVAVALFEVLNYSATRYALHVLGVAGFWLWALPIAFCGIDFAAITWDFAPPVEVWQEYSELPYLISAWLLAVLLNTALIWYGLRDALVLRSLSPAIATIMTTIVLIVRILLFTFLGVRIRAMAEGGR